MLTVETHAKLIELADAHQAADEYVAGTYDAGPTSGCAIGCTIKDGQRLGLIDAGVKFGDHAALAVATGVPELVWRLADSIFESLPSAERPAWPPRLLRAVRPGADYATLPARIMARLADRLAADAIRDDVREVAKSLAVLWRRRAAGEEPGESDWEAAREQADAAREQAGAAWRQAGAAWRQAGAAWRQAYAAGRQEDAALWQADAALWQADAAWEQAGAAWRQAYAAGRQFWRWLADVLCEELEGARLAV